MADPVTLLVPADARYRVLAPEIAAKYAELAGGSPTEGQAVASALSAALDEVATGAAEDAHVDLTLQAESGVVEIALRCEGRSAVVKQPLPAQK
jgi:hypothetical protein